jgi:hypothetical protein
MVSMDVSSDPPWMLLSPQHPSFFLTRLPFLPPSLLPSLPLSLPPFHLTCNTAHICRFGM